MYHEVGIQKLSENQLSKLRNGHPVRVKLGNHHKICLSIQQLKKLHKASKKGSASTITFDPYQLEAHGSGILGNIGRKAKEFVQKYKLQNIVNPVINRVKKESHKGISKLSNYAHSKINELQPIEQGEGIIGDVLGVLGNVAKTAGFGVSRKHSTTPKKPRTRKGKGILTDLAKSAVQSVANKGIEMGANYLKDKVNGMGNKRLALNRRIVGRKAPTKVSKGGFLHTYYNDDGKMSIGFGSKAPKAKRSFGGSGVEGGSLGRSYYDENGNYTVGFGCGGALYPSGYGGALYPA